MGHSFSLEHHRTEDELVAYDECINFANALMLFKYDNSNFVPISFIDFIGSAVSYLSVPIVIVEPLDMPTTNPLANRFIPAQNASADNIDQKYSSADTLKTLYQFFNVTHFILRDNRIWVMIDNSANQSLYADFITKCKQFPFHEFSAVSVLKATDIFYDYKNKNPTPLSFVAALKPPSFINTAAASKFFDLMFSTAAPEAEASTTATSIVTSPISIKTNAPLISSTIDPNASGFHGEPKVMKFRRFRDTDLIPINTNRIRYSPFTTQTIATQPMRPNDCDFVVSNLYIGNEASARDDVLLKKLGVSHIVNINGGIDAIVRDKIDGIEYLGVKMQDSVFEELNNEFWNGIEFIKKAMKSGGTVLVHCKRGISRSAALCAAYLMAEKKMTFDQACALLKKQRPIVNINVGFEKQLKATEPNSHHL